MFETEFEFTLPKGYLDEAGILHRQGVMRLATAMDEIVPLRDPRVKSNPAYATVIILARVMLRLGTLEPLSPSVIERLYAGDLNYLQKFYRRINDLEETSEKTSEETATRPADRAIDVAIDGDRARIEHSEDEPVPVHA